MANLNLNDILNEATGGVSAPQSYVNGRENYVPVAPTDNTAPVRPTTVGSVMGTTPTNTLESIRQQALGIQEQIKNIPVSKKFSAPTAEANPEEPWAPMTAAEERRIQREQMKLFQKEIDATNQIYDELVRNEQIAGEGRLGSVAAIGARSGILGSDFQSAQDEATRRDTASIVGGVEAERAAKIGAILRTARKSAADEIAAKNLANKQGAEAKIAFLAEKKTRRSENLKKLSASLLAQNIDPAELSTDELNALTSSYGVTKDDIISSYATEKAAKPKEDNTFTLSEGQARYDAEGNIIASRAKTYAPKDGDGVIKLTSDNKRTLLGGGWSDGDIASIEEDVRANGLTSVIENARANGATTSQINALKKAYGADKDSGEQFLTKDYFSKLFTTAQLEKAAADAGFGDLGEGLFNLKDVDTEGYLTYLENAIESYRAAGYSDQDILKMMQ